MKNQAALLTKASTLEIIDIPMPEVNSDDVLVEISDVTICGSDMQLFSDPTVGGMFPDIKLPVPICHESAGKVVACGANVKNLKEGDYVAIEPGVPCGHCKWCRSGKYNLCPDVLFMAAPPFTTGALQRYITHSAAYAYKLPENVSTLKGALIEPLSVGMQAVKNASASSFTSVLVLGAGCIGHLTATACKAAGVCNIIMADLFDNRLALASKLDKNIQTVNSGKEDIVKVVMDMTGGEGVDIVFETAGNAYTTKMATKLIKRGGTVCLVGTAPGTVDLTVAELTFKEAKMVSVFRYDHTYPTAIELLSKDIIDPTYVISDVFAFEESQKAFERAINNKQDSLKVAIKLV